jgi:hypothetical protein
MCRSDSEMRNVGVRVGVGHELRPGKEGYCVLEGHPCKVRTVQRSAQNLLRITAIGLFDQKTRSATFGSVEKVFIPTVETKSNILASFSGRGFVIPPLSSSQGLPKVLSWRDDETTKPEHGRHVLLTIITACGYARVMEFVEISEEKAHEVLQRDVEHTLSAESSSQDASSSPTSVLSKKDQRKLKKTLNRLKKVAAVEN